MLSYLRKLIAGLSERERRLVMLMGGVFIVFVIFLTVYVVRSGIGDLEDDISEYRSALSLIAEKEADYIARKRDQQQDKTRGSVKPTPLRTLVDKIGKQLNVTVPDMKELPDQRHSGNWVEHGVELSLREVGLTDLTKFMEEVEGNRRKFPIAITKLEVRSRRRMQNAYDIRMIISTYERVAGEAEAPKRPGAGRKGGL